MKGPYFNRFDTYQSVADHYEFYRIFNKIQETNHYPYNRILNQMQETNHLNFNNISISRDLPKKTVAEFGEEYELHYFVKNRKSEEAKKYLNSPNINKTDDTGNTPLNHACQHNDFEMVQLLLTNPNIDIDVQNTGGYTGLHDAALNNYSNIVLFLLCNNAKTDTQNRFGNTPLHDATYGYYYQVTENLIRFGANKTIKNKDNLTPLDYLKTSYRYYFKDGKLLEKDIANMAELFSKDVSEFDDLCIL